MKDNRGYTLLELLISISLIALILLIVGGAMRLGFRSVDSGERKVESLERYKASLDLMDSQIQSALCIMREGDQGNPGKTVLFSGSREALEFPTSRSVWGLQRGYVVVSFNVEADGHGKKTLVVSESLVGAERKTDTKLLASVDDIHFEYFSQSAFEETGKWVEHWTDRESMPKLVRVTFTDKYGKLAHIIPVRTANAAVGRSPNAGL